CVPDPVDPDALRAAGAVPGGCALPARSAPLTSSARLTRQDPHNGATVVPLGALPLDNCRTVVWIKGGQAETGRPTSAARMPSVAEPSSAGTTPRRSTSSQTAASARTASCHRWPMPSPSRIDDPAIAPIAPAPAPVRNDWAAALPRNASKYGAPKMTNRNDGANAI